MFSTLYRVTQKDFYARPYTSMWAPVVARQISKHFWKRIFLDVGSEEEGPTVWPPRSPDLTPLDFFLHGSLLRTLCTVEKFEIWLI